MALIKASPGYTETIGDDLGIIGSEDGTTHASPDLKATAQDGTTFQNALLRFIKYGHMGIYAESRRNKGLWEFLTIDTESPYLDERPLLTPGTPEIREYRARFWDKRRMDRRRENHPHPLTHPNTPRPEGAHRAPSGRGLTSLPRPPASAKLRPMRSENNASPHPPRLEENYSCVSC